MRHLGTAVVVVAALATLLSGCGSGETKVDIARGTVASLDANGIVMEIDGESYLVGTGTPWRSVDGQWRNGGQPECLPPSSRGAEVEMGLVDVPNYDDFAGNARSIAWLSCESLPITVSGNNENPDSPLYAAYCAQVANPHVC